MQTLSLLKCKLFFTFLFFIIYNSVGAAKYYLAVNGNDENSGTIEQPWATFSHAFSTISGGDTLIVRDGTYVQQMRDFPSGTAGAYTYVIAEHDFGVLIDGAFLGSYERTLYIEDASYVYVRGFKFKSNSEKIGGGTGLIQYSDHIKIIRCGFFDAPHTGNVATVFAGNGSTYVLFEECYAYGGGRYKLGAYSDQTALTEKIIFRRCVARHDYHDYYGELGQVCSTFTSYDCHDVIFQNCISIDSGIQGEDGSEEVHYGRLVGAMNWVCKDMHPQDISGKVQGCIFLNIESYAAIRYPKNNGEHIIENTIIWDCLSGYYSHDTNDNETGTLSLDHMTIGNIWGNPSNDLKAAWGNGVYNGYKFSNQNVTNSNIQDCNYAGLRNYLTSDYNNFYNNTEDYDNVWGVPEIVPGTNDQYENPGMKYICRIEGDSPLKGAASDGGDIGASVVNCYGVSGTLWGEVGYDVLTNEPLWPFPNENEIKAQMSTWTPPASFTGPATYNGKRGFCADGNGLYGGPITLTSYIWEYLGNPCPPEIYGTSSTHDIANPNSIINLRVYPNPFVNSATIEYLLDYQGDVKLTIMDLSGRIIRDEHLSKSKVGLNKYVLNLSTCPNGTYICKLETLHYTATCNLILTH
ncbi:MAG: T9SS type A sorting domain-containing protein [Bacteroidales bacterium]|nr:T9SS type A sorting domain-containing protein [Bacteroidales bacterium]